MEFFKNDFGNVDEAMFECIERPNDFIFQILSIEKIELIEIA
jgi:hypothetical protein